MRATTQMIMLKDASTNGLSKDKQPSNSPSEESLNVNEIQNEENAEAEEPVPKISKNQLKKQARHERWEAGREDRKLKRKMKVKEKKERKTRSLGSSRER